MKENIFNNFKYIKIKNEIKENEDKIQIFSNDFIRKNKYKFKIIYKNKIYSSTKEILISKNTDKTLKLKLILFSKISINNNNDIKGNISPLKYDEIFGYKYKIFPSNLNQFEIKFYENQYCKIDVDNYFSYVGPSFYTYYKLIYNNEPNKERIKILGKNFVDNNKDKCIIIYNDIIFPLKEYLPINYIQSKDNKNDNNTEIQFYILILSLINLINITN